MDQSASRVGILIFDDVEVLDFCGPFEVFSVARPVGQQTDENRLFEVVTISEEDRIINCRGGLMVKPHFTTGDHPPLDILVILGSNTLDTSQTGASMGNVWYAVGMRGIPETGLRHGNSVSNATIRPIVSE